MKQNKFPLGWDDKRVKETLTHYVSQTEEEAVAEDEAALDVSDQAVEENPAGDVGDNDYNLREDSKCRDHRSASPGTLRRGSH